MKSMLPLSISIIGLFFNPMTIYAMRPTSPSNLRATAISTTQIDLTWRDNSNNEAGFKIWRSLDGSNFNWITDVVLNTREFSDRRLAPNTLYYYKITAFNAEGQSRPSNRASARTLSEIPTSPSNLRASISGVAEPWSQIRLNWRDRSNSENGFSIWRSLNGSSYSNIREVSSNTTSYTDINLTPSTTYYYKVKAFNFSGSSNPSNEASATTDPGPSCISPNPPTNLIVGPAKYDPIGALDFTFSDNSDDEDGFYLYRSTNGINFNGPRKS